MSDFKIGIDYGGTKIEGILIDSNGKEILRKRSTYEKNYESGLNTVKSLVSEFDKFTDQQNSVGVCIPGFSSYETGNVPFDDGDKIYVAYTIAVTFVSGQLDNTLSALYELS